MEKTGGTTSSTDWENKVSKMFFYIYGKLNVAGKHTTKSTGLSFRIQTSNSTKLSQCLQYLRDVINNFSFL